MAAPEAEEATAGKGRRGRKRKSPASEADTTESTKTKPARVSDAVRRQDTREFSLWSKLYQ